MASELVSLPSSIVSAGAAATELIVAFRISNRMSDVAVGVQETADEIVVRVQAALDGLSEPSGGWFPHFTHASERVALQRPLGARRVRAVPDIRHSAGVC